MMGPPRLLCSSPSQKPAARPNRRKSGSRPWARRAARPVAPRRRRVRRLHYFAAQLRHIDARKQTSSEPMPESGKGYQAPPGTVTYERDELRFMLHRHWSLFDAMYYSNYVAARLSVWKHDGKRRLQELLAKIGLSLEACRQTYAVSLDERTSLRDNLKVQGRPTTSTTPSRRLFTEWLVAAET